MENSLVEFREGQLVVDAEALAQIKAFYQKKAVVEYLEKSLKRDLLEQMEAHGITSFDFGGVKAIYKAAYKRSTVDSTRLKKEKPEIYAEYQKETEVKPSVSLTVETND